MELQKLLTVLRLVLVTEVRDKCLEGLVKITFELHVVHYIFSLPGGQAQNLVFFATCICEQNYHT